MASFRYGSVEPPPFGQSAAPDYIAVREEEAEYRPRFNLKFWHKPRRPLLIEDDRLRIVEGDRPLPPVVQVPCEVATPRIIDSEPIAPLKPHPTCGGSGPDPTETKLSDKRLIFPQLVCAPVSELLMRHYVLMARIVSYLYCDNSDEALMEVKSLILEMKDWEARLGSAWPVIFDEISATLILEARARLEFKRPIAERKKMLSKADDRFVSASRELGLYLNRIEKVKSNLDTYSAVLNGWKGYIDGIRGLINLLETRKAELTIKRREAEKVAAPASVEPVGTEETEEDEEEEEEDVVEERRPVRHVVHLHAPNPRTPLSAEDRRGFNHEMQARVDHSPQQQNNSTTPLPGMVESDFIKFVSKFGHLLDTLRIPKLFVESTVADNLLARKSKLSALSTQAAALSGQEPEAPAVSRAPVAPFRPSAPSAPELESDEEGSDLDAGDSNDQVVDLPDEDEFADSTDPLNISALLGRT